ALFRDFTRQDAARFSFLLGIPAIALAGLHELVVLARAHLPFEGWMILLVGLVIGSLSSFAALWGLMRILERFSTLPFICYR
ncbi:undecaprenyl-diphosphate phosphatase, partial [Escherichia coli]|nr:undecaprenyl-diphosphate phosphatase [Escherichia coli]